MPRAGSKQSHPTQLAGTASEWYQVCTGVTRTRVSRLLPQTSHLIMYQLCNIHHINRCWVWGGRQPRRAGTSVMIQHKLVNAVLQVIYAPYALLVLGAKVGCTSVLLFLCFFLVLGINSNWPNIARPTSVFVPVHIMWYVRVRVHVTTRRTSKVTTWCL